MIPHDMDVVILCGGQGTRLRSAIGESQKVMAEVSGQPFLDILLEYLKDQGFQRIILCTGFKAQAVEAYYREQKKFPQLTLEFSQENSPLGTGGALKNAKNLIKSNPFIVLNGDCFCRLDYKRFVDFHLSREALATIVVTQVPQNKDFGNITLDQSSRIIAFQEKGETSLNCYVSTGIYCLSGEKAFDRMPSPSRFSLEYDYFPYLVDHGFYGYRVEKSFMDIGTPERYQKAQHKFLKKDKKIED